MPPAKDHAAMQRSVCTVCFRKPKNLRNITPRLKISLKEFVWPNYDTEDWDWLPTVICQGCYKGLYDAAKDPR